MNPFSLRRFGAMVLKEFIQMRRDRLTFMMMVGIPLLQLILFGYAINSDPRHLPTAVILRDHGPFARRLIDAMERTGYFKVVATVDSEARAEEWLQRGEVQFIVTIPEDFETALVRGERPAVLVEADATDPSATSAALAATSRLLDTALASELKGPLASLLPAPAPVEFRTHARYNPEGITQYNVVPGLMGVVLTMTMVVITSLAITRERERGTMENLLSTPVRPAEVLVGKIVPYVVVGYIQITLILIAARFLFQVPIGGSVALVYAAALLFITANLAMGITFSTIARNQLQAVQMSFFFFLPNILLSGFMFPFRGMPEWAQAIGTVLPLTHFLRVVRGVLLKGSGLAEIWPELVPIAAFAAVALALGVKRYRQTLD